MEEANSHWSEALLVLSVIVFLIIFYRLLNTSKSVYLQKRSLLISSVFIIWLLIQGGLGFKGFFVSALDELPPRIVVLGILPILLLLTYYLIFDKRQQQWMTLPLFWLTIIHITRLPVELALRMEYANGLIPELMTFGGKNFDILAGITAPIAAFLWASQGKINQTALLLWNILCIFLLLNIATLGFLSAPTPLQKMAFDQPNFAVLNFPFCWLPTFLVPVLLFCHICSIRSSDQMPD
ncbi:MAG TPA: hypothetical protein PKD57_04950 [Saprospiraceae bacterium]|nr:hypothetical protein [Saprospiraceae bacterium]